METMRGPLLAGVVLCQAGIAAALVVAVRRADTAAAVNAVLALAVAFLVPVLGTTLPVRGTGFGSVLALWVGLAGLLHCVGMLGLYDGCWWWDHVTHGVSAALVAALLYAGFLASVADPNRTALPPELAGTAAVSVTLAIGILWELVELLARELGEALGVEPVLVHYGWRDTAFDLVFDVLGAVAVVGLDVRLFVGVAEQFPSLNGQLLVWSCGVVSVASLLSVVGIWVVR
jgi:hypothetical protein